MFPVTFIMLEHVKVGKHIEHIRQKLSKSMLIVKFHPGMKCLDNLFYFFYPGMKFYSYLFEKNELILG